MLELSCKVVACMQVCSCRLINLIHIVVRQTNGHTESKSTKDTYQGGLESNH